MKKLLIITVLMAAALSSHAQFEQGKHYIGASLTGLSLSYSGTEELNLGLEAKGGYLVADDWMLTAQASYQHSGVDGVYDRVSVGVGGRYYVVQNGLYVGLNAKLVHAQKKYNDLMPGLEIGYAFFINRSVTIEPAVYYDQSLKNHSDYSTVGLRVGIGVYL